MTRSALPQPVTVEHHRAPLGIGEATPALSWTTQAPAGWAQQAYEIAVTRGDDVLHTGRIEGADSVLVPWPIAPLVSRERVDLRVRLWGSETEPSGWSAPTAVEAGLLEPGDWTAVPVGAGWPEDPDAERRPAQVRRAFELADRVVSARLYVSAHGLYEVEINGRRVGSDALAPGWTVYGERLRYYTHDVTELVAQGDNVIGAWLGDGWYRGRFGWVDGNRNLYGSDQSLIAQLEVTLADGSVRTVATDADWLAAPGPIISSNLYDGEVYDARQFAAGWSEAGFGAEGWSPVKINNRDLGTLVAPTGPPVRCTEEITPVEVIDTPSGKQVLDLGQNIAGRLWIRISGAAGDTVTIRTAEVMQDGEIYARPLRTARSTDVYTLAGDGVEEWEPRFTIHGFRYAEIEGWPGDLEEAVRRGDVVARVYHSDMVRTGWFESSDPMLNRLHENVVWSMRGNFVDIPTDCPQRDERLGWTGDIQIFGPTASFLYDCSGFLTSWLSDVAAEQLDDGTVPWYVPVIPGGKMWTPLRPGAAWGDVAVLTPWTLYERFGDTGILAQQFDSARAWVDLMDRLSGHDHLWNDGFQLGDWLDPAAPPDDPADARTDRYLVASAYFAWSTRHLAKMAEVLGHADEAETYGRLADEVREAFRAEYLTAEGRMTSDAQTAYAVALQFDLVPAELRAAVGARLAELVHEADNRIATGFVGTPLVSDALSETGQLDAAYALLLERECPSWLYPVTQGATTVWERWDSQLPDGRVNPGQMTSFNHYALGAVADWLHRVVAGLAPTSPGYRTVQFRPRPGGGLRSASARHESPYGTVTIDWRIEGADDLVVDVQVPVGVSASVELPGAEPIEVGHGSHQFTGRSAEAQSR